MKKLDFLIVFSSLLAACSHLPPFQKVQATSPSVGYWNKTIEADGSLAEVYVRLDKEIEDLYRYRRRYMLVAAANVCLEKGFLYSDTLGSTLEKVEGSFETKKSVVYCSNDKNTAILNVEIKDIPLSDGNALVITSLSPEDLAPKKNSKLIVGDTITKINGERIFDVSRLQYHLTRAGKQKQKTVKLEVVRNSKSLVLDEEVVFTDLFSKENKKIANLRNF